MATATKTTKKATTATAKKAPAKKAAATKKTVAAKATTKKAPAKAKPVAETTRVHKALQATTSVVTAMTMDTATGKVLDSAVMNVENAAGQPAAELLKAAALTVQPTHAATPAATAVPNDGLTARQRRRNARKQLRAANMAAASAAGLKPIRQGTKRSKVFELLANPAQGITLDELVKKTGETADAVRTVLNKNVKAKGYEVLRQQEGERGEVLYLGLKGNKIGVEGILYAAPAAQAKAPAATA